MLGLLSVTVTKPLEEELIQFLVWTHWHFFYPLCHIENFFCSKNLTYLLYEGFFHLYVTDVTEFIQCRFPQKKFVDCRVTSLGRRTIVFWIVAVVCWINDRLYCEIWSALGFPYLHGFWHILIFLVKHFVSIKMEWKTEVIKLCLIHLIAIMSPSRRSDCLMQK